MLSLMTADSLPCVGDTLYSGAHGSRSFDADQPMTIATAGWLASMTKLMTSVATLHAVQNGLVGLDDDVREILSQLKNKEILVAFNKDTGESRFEPVTESITLRYAS